MYKLSHINFLIKVLFSRFRAAHFLKRPLLPQLWINSYPQWIAFLPLFNPSRLFCVARENFLASVLLRRGSTKAYAKKDAWQVRTRARRPIVLGRRTSGVCVAYICTSYEQHAHETTTTTRTRRWEGREDRDDCDAPCTGLDSIDRIPPHEFPCT